LFPFARYSELSSLGKFKTRTVGYCKSISRKFFRKLISFLMGSFVSSAMLATVGVSHNGSSVGYLKISYAFAW
jgi:hypothetical protein